MITFHPTHLEVSLPVATALLAFASKDTTRPHLGIGIGGRALCATDGHTLVLFEASDSAPDACHQLKLWSRSHVETALKVARAKKAPVVQLLYSDTLADLRLPPVLQVVPVDGLEASEPIGFNPEHLGRLTLVAKACGADGARMVAARGPLDPLAFKVGNPGAGLSATAVVMPMRV